MDEVSEGNDRGGRLAGWLAATNSPLAVVTARLARLRFEILLS